MEQERMEQRRYDVLAKLYLLTGTDRTNGITPQEMETQLDVSPDTYLPLIEDLTRLGYVRHVGSGGAVAITEKGVEYMQRAAWRRRSIRS